MGPCGIVYWMHIKGVAQHNASYFLEGLLSEVRQRKEGRSRSSTGKSHWKGLLKEGGFIRCPVFKKHAVAERTTTLYVPLPPPPTKRLYMHRPSENEKALLENMMSLSLSFCLFDVFLLRKI